MHNARVSKDQFWEFAAEVRRVYLEEHPAVQLFRSGVFQKVKYNDLMKSLTDNDDFVELQLFDEGDAWLIRPLEVGWFFINKLDKGAWDKWGVTAVTYDNRCDVPPEDEKNRMVADWMDEQIEARRYLVFNVLHKDDYRQIYLDIVTSSVATQEMDDKLSL